MKKKLLFPIIGITTLVIALVVYFAVAMNYKKEYVFDNTYSVRIDQDPKTFKNEKKGTEIKEKYSKKIQYVYQNNPKSYTFSGDYAYVTITIIDPEQLPKTVVKETIVCHKIVLQNVDYEIENKSIVDWYFPGYKFSCTYVEYPLFKSKNKVVAKYHK